MRAEPRRISEVAPKQLRKFSYVDRGCYAEQLHRAFQVFPREQCLIIKYEEFRAQQRETIESVFRFLNLPAPRFRQLEAHSIRYSRPIHAEERKLVSDLVVDDVAQLEAMLGWNCSDWR